MTHPTLSVIGARQHNLKNVTCELPREKLVVITGPSGSGKSSLAFDTIHAEAYRRYVEFLPSTVRRSLHHLSRPEVDEITGLSPSVAMRQGFVSPSPRATVGTITETSDYLRVLFARCATAHCPVAGHPLHSHTAQSVVRELEAQPPGTKMTLLAPLASDAPPQRVTDALMSLKADGFARVSLNGVAALIDEIDTSTLAAQSSLDLIVDRLIAKPGSTSRIADSVELALRRGNGVMLVDFHDGRVVSFSETFYCHEHRAQVPSLEPNLFSHLSPEGACPRCNGRGFLDVLVPDRVVPNPALTLRQGALAVFGVPGSVGYALFLNKLSKLTGVDTDTPWHALAMPGDFWEVVEQTLRDEEGELLDGALTSRERASFYEQGTCPTCNGTRLGAHRNWFTLDAQRFSDVAGMRLNELATWLERLAERASDMHHAATPLLDVLSRKVAALTELGLGYLSLNTPLQQVASGELQRIRLSCMLGTALSSVLYVIDEPTVGLHPNDAALVVGALRRLTIQGNSVVAVDHSRTLIEAADWLVDLGPGAGRQGGQLLAVGPPDALARNPESVTGRYLSSRPQLAQSPLAAPRSWLEVNGVRCANLNLSVKLPKQRLTAVTGRSGAGKTSLLMGALLPAARAIAQRGAPPPSLCDTVAGADFARVITFDQSSLGASLRSTPATYTGVWDVIRELFATLPEARTRGFKAGRFSFNIKGGRCEHCKGEGALRAGLELMADVLLTCPECNGTRFNQETLLPKFRGLSVADVLALNVDDAQRLFAHLPKINRVLLSLQRLGLGYLTLGQPSSTLSGGEAQRVRFALELSKQGDGTFLYLFDEPTMGLHFSDLPNVVESLFSLRDAGHTVVVAEHNPDIVSIADWVVELGPGAGEHGGTVCFSGPREEWARRR